MMARKRLGGGVPRPQSSCVRAFGMAALIAAVASTPMRAIAAGDPTAAARAFSEGQQAQLGGDYTTAAGRFELANSIIPAPEALRSAARARWKAGQKATAAKHAHLLLQRYPDDEESKSVAQAILDDVADDLALVEVSCTPECALISDGSAVSPDPATEHVFYVYPGRHLLEAKFAGGLTAKHEVEDARGSEHIQAVLRPDPSTAPTTAQASGEQPSDAGAPPPEMVARPPAGPMEQRHQRFRLHPGWTYAGIALTVASGATLTWSAVDTKRARDAFVGEPTQVNWDAGRQKQLRTNVLIGVTSGLAAASVLVAAIGTDWKKARRRGKQRAHIQWLGAGTEVRF